MFCYRETMFLLIWTLQCIAVQVHRKLSTQHYQSLEHPSNCKKIYASTSFSESACMKFLNMLQRRYVPVSLFFIILALSFLLIDQRSFTWRIWRNFSVCSGFTSGWISSCRSVYWLYRQPQCYDEAPPRLEWPKFLPSFDPFGGMWRRWHLLYGTWYSPGAEERWSDSLPLQWAQSLQFALQGKTRFNCISFGQRW